MRELEHPDTYVPSPCDSVLQDMERSVAVFGSPGSGRSTAFARMHQQWGREVLAAEWQSPPPGKYADVAPQVAAFMTVRSAVAESVVSRLRVQPELFSALSDVSREFLRWLLEAGLEDRRRKVLRKIVPHWSDIETIPFTNLYPDLSADSVRCQVDEMIVLARDLGAEKVAVCLNAPDDPTPEQQELIRLVFAWRDLWEQSEFLLKATLTSAVVAANDLVRLARGRIVYVRMEWSLAQSWQVAERWAHQVMGQPVALATMAEPELLDEVAAMLLDIHGEHRPLGWSTAGSVLGDLHKARARVLSQEQDGAAIRRRLYHHLAPLQIEADGSGVRRGHRHIQLSGLPLRLLEALVKSRDDETSETLMQLAHTKGNLYKQISKLREAVEPLPHGSSDWVYVRRIGESNYVLEGANSSPAVRLR